MGGSRRAGRPMLLTSILTVLGTVACGDRDPGADARLSLLETLAGADTAGYARATEARPFTFPRDHGPHPAFRTEWWYVTGNLADAGGRRFGFQLTIFRNALAPTAPDLASGWATNQAYMGHFTLTDVDGDRFQAFERFSRGAAGLAGAEIDPRLRVWIDQWVIQGASGSAASGTDARDTAANGSGIFPLRLRASADAVALDLTLDAGKPPVLQGEDGLSQKGPEPGNASYYYSLTRMPTEGSIVLDGARFAVSGLAWLDREWSTSALSGDQVGWDWFALQLDDGWDVMAYQLRRSDGTADPLSEAALVGPAGEKVPLTWGEDVVLEPTGRWRSPIDGAEYPSGWRLRIPARGWDVRIDPVVEDQELDLAFRYWEGAVLVTGTGEGGRQVGGRGYVELTGYAGEPRRR